MATENIQMDYSKYDFKDSTDMYVHLSKKGLSKETVIGISKMKDEPQWMLDFRLLIFKISIIMQRLLKKLKKIGKMYLKMSKTHLTN